MSQSRFQLIYAGPGVTDGSMDVSALGPALTAAGDLIRESNHSLNGDDATIVVRADSTFKRGSFVIDLILDQNVRDAVTVALPAITLVHAEQLVHAVFGVAEKTKGVITGAMAIYKAVRGEKPKDTASGPTNKSIVLVFGNNNRITVDQDSGRLYLNDEVRRGLGGTSSPLLRDGINEFRITKDEAVLDSISRSDLPVDDIETLTAPPESVVESPRPRELLVRVVKPNFDGGRWSFSDGAAKFGADVEDKDFQERVKSREIGFFQGDTLRILLRTDQHLDHNNRLITTNTVEKVLEYKPGARQLQLLDSE